MLCVELSVVFFSFINGDILINIKHGFDYDYFLIIFAFKFKFQKQYNIDFNTKQIYD